MNLLRTERTYLTQDNALKALQRACTKYEIDISRLRYLIAVKDDGRFAPVVIGREKGNLDNNLLWVVGGITWVS